MALDMRHSYLHFFFNLCVRKIHIWFVISGSINCEKTYPEKILDMNLSLIYLCKKKKSSYDEN